MRTNEGVFDINLSAGPAEMGNEFLTLLDELREYDPVYWNKTANCWMITAYFTAKLPPIIRQSCHPLHTKAATHYTAKLPPPGR